jgi:tRNA/tmRNA/rRNA uracil-C5-methylase (TrmA/RlmC/RlmD family)
MMGRQTGNQGQLFYLFNLESRIPAGHLLRRINPIVTRVLADLREKPVECMKRPMENNSSTGQAVYDPFCGSGTTIIAAEITGRVCHAVELSPAYVDVAIKRWEAFTGHTATLEATKERFAEVAAKRTGATCVDSIVTSGVGG